MSSYPRARRSSTIASSNIEDGTGTIRGCPFEQLERGFRVRAVPTDGGRTILRVNLLPMIPYLQTGQLL